MQDALMKTWLSELSLTLLRCILSQRGGTHFRSRGRAWLEVEPQGSPLFSHGRSRKRLAVLRTHRTPSGLVVQEKHKTS